MWTQFAPAFRMMLLLTALTGLVYPALVTVLCQAAFSHQANGSLVTDAKGAVVGSALLGQNFAKPEYFQPRPSAAGNDGYDASASSGSNLGPTSKKLIDRVKADVSKFREANPEHRGPVPADAVTSSGSGLDPHITPENAAAQAPRIAKVRGVRLDEVHSLISQNTKERDFGLFGEPRVNVLLLNIALDQHLPRR